MSLSQGTAIVYPKSFAYLLANSGEFKVISLKNKEVGKMTIELLPCSGEQIKN